MSAKSIIILGLKVIALTIILSVTFMVAGAISIGSEPVAGAAGEPSPADAGATLLPLLVTSFLQTVVFTYIMLRSRWTGWKLIGAVFLAFYGLHTVVSQIESAVYLTTQLPPGMVPRLFLMGAIIAGVFSPLAVLILGKMRRKETAEARNLRLVMPLSEWAWKLAAIGAAYLLLYYTFGYFVAWRNPAVQAYYGGTDPGSFFAQMAGIWSATPWMFAWQAFRGLLFAAFVLPVIRMHRGQRWEVTLAMAALFAVWSSALLLPNAFMPAAVARAHLVETAGSMFIFGLLVGWLLSGRHSASEDVVRLSPLGKPAEIVDQ
jgi:hypothetical protein